jgi:hypothetical protein
MVGERPVSLKERFSILEDTRDPIRRRHTLIDLLVIAIAAGSVGLMGVGGQAACSVSVASSGRRRYITSPGSGRTRSQARAG